MEKFVRKMKRPSNRSVDSLVRPRAGRKNSRTKLSALRGAARHRFAKVAILETTF